MTSRITKIRLRLEEALEVEKSEQRISVDMYNRIPPNHTAIKVLLESQIEICMVLERICA